MKWRSFHQMAATICPAKSYKSGRWDSNPRKLLYPKQAGQTRLPYTPKRNTTNNSFPLSYVRTFSGSTSCYSILFNYQSMITRQIISVLPSKLALRSNDLITKLHCVQESNLSLSTVGMAYSASVLSPHQTDTM